MEKNSKVAIVTGASRRIGRAVAKRLARDEQRFGEVLSDVRTIHRVEGGRGRPGHVLANELRGRNVTVNAVAPGPVATELFRNDKTQAQIDQLSKLPPLERLASTRISPTWYRFLPGPRAVGSTPSSCVPMAASHNASRSGRT
jgi:NAD(P)-dependent dehydrogenase (short-subunit alcohol dehydrogenase family)